MNPMELMMMLQNSGNPMAMMQSLARQNPMLGRAMAMGEGKSPVQMKETVRNLARQRGMSDEQLSQFLGKFGVYL